MTHGIGVPLGIAALAWMVVRSSLHGTAVHVVTSAIYGTSIVLLYAASSLYHSGLWAGRRQLWRTIDHACIYILIAGSYTPFALAAIGGTFGWVMFGTVWGIAALGSGFKAFTAGRFEVLSTLTYMAMGWMAVIAIPTLLEVLPVAALAWILAGGLAYTVGVLFYALDERIPYGHAIWHLCCLGGTTAHLMAVCLYVIP